MAFINLDEDRKMHYEVIGDGEPLLLIHGFTNYGFAWLPQVSDLTYSGYKVILPDLPGHGQSSNITEKTTVSDLTSCIIQLLDHLKIDSVLVGGLSLGGMIVQELITVYPHRIKKAIIANSSYDFTTQETNHAVQGWKQMFSQPNGPVLRLKKTFHMLFNHNFTDTSYANSLYRSWEKVLGSKSGDSFSHIADGMLEHNKTQDFQKVDVPTLIITGTEDQLISMDQSIKMHELIKNSRLVIIEHGGHISNIDSTNDFNQAIIEFLQEY